MNRRSHARVLVTAALAFGLALGTTGVASAMPASEQAAHPSTLPAAQKYYWMWSDDYATLSRTFKKSDYGDESALPYLIAKVKPASPRQTVNLEFQQDGDWITETKKKTNSSGVAKLYFNPWCNAAHTNWCDGTWTYKMSIQDVAKKFKIKFSSK